MLIEKRKIIRDKTTLIAFVFLGLYTIIIFSQNYFKNYHIPDYNHLLTLLYFSIIYSSFAVFTPIIRILGKRWPVTPPLSLAVIVKHTSVAILLMSVHMLLCNLVLFGMDLTPSIIYPKFLMKYLTTVSHIHIIIYWVILLILSYQKDGTTEDENYLKIKADGEYRKILFTDILAIEAIDHYKKIITKDRVFIIKISMSDLCGKLPSFLKQIHRSSIINFNKIVAAKPENGKWSVTLSSGQCFNVSSTYINKVKSYLIRE